MSRTRAMRTLVPLALGAALTIPLSASAADKEPVLRLRAFAVDLTNSAHTRILDIVIERWSTPQEVKNFQAALSEGGDEALLKALQRTSPRCGYVRGDVKHSNIHAASEIPMPGGGRKVVLATDRPVWFWEALDLSTLHEYRFSIAEIRLGPDGKGEGKAIPYAKVGFNKDTKELEILNYETLPLRVVQVSVVGPKRAANR